MTVPRVLGGGGGGEGGSLATQSGGLIWALTTPK